MAKDIKAVPAIATEILNSDDRALSLLNDLSSIDQLKATLDVDELQDRADKLLAALRYFRADAVKDLLDRSYLEALGRGEDEDISTVDDSSGAAVVTIQGDLGSLYAEIDDLVAMVASHEHGNSISVTLRNVQRLQKKEKNALNEQVGHIQPWPTELKG